MRKPSVNVVRSEVMTQVGGKPTILLVVSCAGYSIHVRVPPSSSCAFVDSWSLPDPRKKDGGVLEVLLDRMLKVVHQERPYVKMLVESQDSFMVHVLQWHGFKTNTRFGSKTEMLNDFTG